MVETRTSAPHIKLTDVNDVQLQDPPPPDGTDSFAAHRTLTASIGVCYYAFADDDTRLLVDNKYVTLTRCIDRSRLVIFIHRMAVEETQAAMVSVWRLIVS